VIGRNRAGFGGEDVRETRKDIQDHDGDRGHVLRRRVMPRLMLGLAGIAEGLATVLIFLWVLLVAGNFVGLVITISVEGTGVLGWLADPAGRGIDLTMPVVAGIGTAVFFVFARILAEAAADLGNWADDHYEPSPHA
jgi:hypothetical protein